MTVRTAAGSRLFIGPANEVADTQEEFEALSPYVEVGEIEDLGEIGDTAGEVTFTELGNRRVRKLKGSFNAGSLNLVVGYDAGDAGQAAMLAAFPSDSDYAFKITLNDAVDEDSDATPTTIFFRAKVMSKPLRIGAVENVVRRAFTLGINSEVIEVAPDDHDS